MRKKGNFDVMSMSMYGTKRLRAGDTDIHRDKVFKQEIVKHISRAPAGDRAAFESRVREATSIVLKRDRLDEVGSNVDPNTASKRYTYFVESGIISGYALDLFKQEYTKCKKNKGHKKANYSASNDDITENDIVLAEKVRLPDLLFVLR